MISQEELYERSLNLPKSFIDAIYAYKKTLSAASNKVRALEYLLKENGFFFTFDMIIDAEEDGNSTHLSWEHCEGGKKNWRVCVIERDHVDEIKAKTTFLEQRIDARLRLSRFIDQFLVEFEKFIVKETEDANKKILGEL